MRRTRPGRLAPVLGCLLLLAIRTTLAADGRPNILFAFADDWGRYASAYARVDGPGSPNDVIKTPSFDRIAREGVLFRHAFVTAPSCTPCRSSLLSGQYFWRTDRGAILIGAVWDPKIPSYPLLLRDAGYHIGQTYKVWSPGAPLDAPYGGNATGYETAGNRFPRFSTNVTSMTARGMSVEAAKAWLVTHRNDAQWARFFQLAFAKRPREELFVLTSDPDQVHNVAGEARYEKIRKELKARLMEELTRTGDPRVTGDGTTFDKPPFAGPVVP